MDPRVEKLRAAGFSDQDIQEYLKDNPAPPSTATSNQVTGTEPSSVSMEVPPTNPADIPPEPSWMETGATALRAIMPENPTDLAIKGGEGYLAYKGIQGWREHSAANKARAAAEMAREQGIQNRFNARYPVAPEAPPAAPPAAEAPKPPTRLESSMGRPAPSGPVNPSSVPARPTVGGPAAAEGSNFITSLAQKYGPALGRAGVGITAALMPGNVGQTHNFPTKGPLAGNEINPNTRRPWTPQELQMYNAQYQ